MRKVLSFCVLSMLFAVLTLGLKAQTSGLMMSPANLPNPIPLNQYDTIMLHPDSDCFRALGLNDDDKVSIEWKVLYNGQAIPADSFSFYFEEFKFESRYDWGNAEKWWGSSYVSHYCQNNNGFGSYPGANIPVQGLEIGQQCEDPGHFNVCLPGQNEPYEFDYFFVRWFQDSIKTGHRLVYNIKIDGDYQFIFNIAGREGGSKWNQFYVGNDERYCIGGHHSTVTDILSSDTLRIFHTKILDTIYVCASDLPFVFPGTTDTFWMQTPPNMYDTVVLHSYACCRTAIDSILLFRLMVRDPQEPVLRPADCDLVVCDNGQITLAATPVDADKIIWYNAIGDSLTTVMKDSVYRITITDTTIFIARSFSSAGCISIDSLVVTAYTVPTPTPNLTVDTTGLCLNTGDFTFTVAGNGVSTAAIKWYKDTTTELTETTTNLVVSSANAANAGSYHTTVTNTFTHALLPGYAKTCAANSDTVTIKIFEIPSLTITQFDGQANTNGQGGIFCKNETSHTAEFEITNGLTPYTLTWSNAAFTHDVTGNIATTSLVSVPTCDTISYTDTILSGKDANGCAITMNVNSIVYTLQDTDVPHITMRRTDTTAIPAMSNCEYVLPNILSCVDTVVDGCSTTITVQQAPIAGTKVDSTQFPYTMYIYAEDECGHKSVDSVIVTNPTLPLVVTNVEVTQRVKCAGDANGAIRVTMDNGTKPYQVTITSDENPTVTYTQTNINDSVDFTSLVKGKWDIVVTDANGCEITLNDTANVASPEALNMDSLSQKNPTCHNFNNGELQYKIEKGTAPYNVSILKDSAGIETANFITRTNIAAGTFTETNLFAATYTIVVTDDSLCTDTIKIILTQPDSLLISSIVKLNDVDCYGNATGNVAVESVIGGTPAYTFTWKDAANTIVSNDSVTGRILLAGTYTVEVTDANNCPSFVEVGDKTIEVTQNPKLEVTSLTVPNAMSCPRQATYPYEAVVAGGSLNYDITWTDNAGTNTETDKTALTYTYEYLGSKTNCAQTITVTFEVVDDSNCTASKTATYNIIDNVAPTFVGTFNSDTIYGCGYAQAYTMYPSMTTVQQLIDKGENIAIDDNCTDSLQLIVKVDTVLNYPGGIHCPYSVTRNYWVEDSCGNASAKVAYTVVVIDNIAPTFTKPANTYVLRDAACNADTNVTNTGKVLIVNDECTGNNPADFVISYTDQVVNFQGANARPDHLSDSIYRTWTVTDQCGNTAAPQTQIILVYDSIEPVITWTPTVSAGYIHNDTIRVACSDFFKSSISQWFHDKDQWFVATDGCGIYNTKFDSLTTTPGCNKLTYVETWVYTAIDNYGNVSKDTVYYQVYDDVAPYIVAYPTINKAVEVDTTTNIAATYQAWKDELQWKVDTDCDSVGVDTTITTTIIPGCGRTAKYVTKWFITDGCNDITYIDTFNLIDKMPPIFDTLTLVLNTIVDCDGAGNLAQFKDWLFRPRAFDGVENGQRLYDSVTMTYFSLLPTLAQIDTVAAHGDIDGINYYIKENDCKGLYHVQWEATDRCGNKSTTSEKFEIHDLSAPEITYAPADYEISCDSTTAYIEAKRTEWFESLTATDVCTDSATISWTKINTEYPCGTNTCAATETWRWTIADTCGNNTTLDRKFRIYDSLAPRILTVDGNTDVLDTLKLDLTADCQNPTTQMPQQGTKMLDDILTNPSVRATYGNIAKYFDCTDSTAISVLVFDNGLDNAHSTACKKVYTYSYIFIDACGNKDTLQQVAEVGDHSAPTYTQDIEETLPLGNATTCAWPTTPNFTSASEINTYQPAVAIKDCNLSETTATLNSTVDKSTTYPFVRTKYYTLADPCGNDTTIKHIITVIDTTAPVFVNHQNAGSNTITDTIEMNASCGFNAGDTTAIYNSIKNHTHTGFHVEDCTDSIITLVTAGTMSAVSCYSTLTSEFVITDKAGNTTTFTHITVIKDVTKPVVSNMKDSIFYSSYTTACDPIPFTQFTTVGDMRAWQNDPTFIKDCNVDANTAITLVSGDTSVTKCPEVITYTYNVTDACGNVSDNFTLKITIEDTVSPKITGAMPDVTVAQISNNDCPDVVYTTYTSVASLPAGITIGDCNLKDALTYKADTIRNCGTNCCSQSYTIKVTYTTSDSCGNSTNFVQTIFVEDTLAPTITGTLKIDSLTLQDDCSYVIDTLKTVAKVHAHAGNLTIVDCKLDSAVTLVSIDTMPGTTCPLEIVATYKVTDSCGTKWSKFTHTIHLFDKTAPVLTDATLDTVKVYIDSLGGYLVPAPYSTVAQLTTNGVSITECYDPTMSIKNTQIDTTINKEVCAGSFVRELYTIEDMCHNEAVLKAERIILLVDTIKPWVNGLANNQYFEVVATNCEFKVPDFKDTIANHFKDNWVSKMKDFTQSPVKDTRLYQGDTVPVVITFTDTCDLSTTITFNAYAPDSLYIVSTDVDSVSCYGYNDGSITVTIAGGKADYNYKLDGTDKATQTALTYTYNNLKAKDGYVVKIVDANGCTADKNVDVKQPDTLILTLAVNPACDNEDITMEITTIGGNSTHYLLAWINGDTNLTLSDSIAHAAPIALYDTTFQLNAGTYGFHGKVVDEKGCIAVHDTIAKVNPSYKAEKTDSVCANKPYTFGTIALTPANYNFTGSTKDTTYIDTVATIAGCDSIFVLHLTVLDTPVVNITMLPVLCNGESNGGFTAAVQNGGTAPFTYAWNGGVVDDSTTIADSVAIKVLPAGTYVITVTDTFGCAPASTNITVTEPNLFEFVNSFSPVTDNCDTGEVTVHYATTGGTGTPNIIVLLDGDTITNVKRNVLDTTYALTAGTYRLDFIAIDSNGCRVDNDTMVTIDPTYLFEYDDRICNDVTTYTFIWGDSSANSVATFTKGGWKFPNVTDTILVIDTIMPTIHGCDSIYRLHLTIESKPFFKLRRLADNPSGRYPHNYLSNLSEYNAVDTFANNATNVGWEIFVDNNCTSCVPDIPVSIKYELYRLDTTTNTYIPMSQVQDYFRPYYVTYFDFFVLDYTPNNNGIVNIPEIYVPYGAGTNWHYTYWNLCWLSPTYPGDIPANAHTMGTYQFYDDARANAIKITGFGSELTDGTGDYKIVAKMIKYESNLAINSSENFTWPTSKVGGNFSGTPTIETVYDSIEMKFHVYYAAPVGPAPFVEPIGGDVTFTDNETTKPEAHVFPNPANNFVQVELQGFEGETKVTLSGSNGKVLKTIELDIVDGNSTPIVKIETADYAQGIYLVTARNKNAIVTKRVVLIK